MASTADCKKLLEEDPAVRAAGGAGTWKRLSKRAAPEGVERIFQDQKGACFVRVTENAHGTISVAAVAPTLEGLGVDVSTEKKKPARPQGAAPPLKPGRLCWNVNTDAAAQAAAKKAVRLLFKDDGEEAGDPDLYAKAGSALANRMLFGVIGGVDEDMGTEGGARDDAALGVCVAIVPDVHWERTGYWYDQPLFLEQIMAHPECAESPNETSEHLLHGHATVKDAVWMLLDQGFVWDASLQASITQNHQPLPWLADWLAAGAPGRPEAAQAPPPAQTIPVATFSAWHAALSQHEHAHGKDAVTVAVLSDPTAAEAGREFWEASDRLLNVLNKVEAGREGGPWQVVHVLPGSEVEATLCAQEGSPLQPGQWQPVLVRQGKVDHTEVGGLLTSGWQQIIARLSPRPSRPKV